MKSILTVLLTVLTISISIAQTPDKVLARVRYTYINKTDNTTQKGKPRAENMLLFLGKNASLYTSYDKINYEIAEDQKSMARAIAQAGNSSAPKMIKVDRSAGEWLSKIEYFLYSQSQKLFIKENIIGTGFLTEEELPKINWKITKDTTNLSGVSCKKATANFEGKNWVAWFAPSLPFQSGPWKLSGLPGLIIEAFVEDKTTQFQFAGFEKANDGDFIRANDIKKRPSYQAGDISNVDVSMGLDVAGAYYENVIQLPTYRIVKTTKKELEKLKEAYQKDPRGFSKALYGF